MLSRWFLTDIIRRATEVVRSTFDYCLSPSCSTTSVKRARSLSRVVVSASSLIFLSTGFKGALGNMIYRLLLYRLQEGPRTGWENVDNALRNVFEAKLSIMAPKQNILAALDVLRTENWGEEGKGLRVGNSSCLVYGPQLIAFQSLIISFFRHCLPLLDADTLQAIVNVVRTNGNVENAEDLLSYNVSQDARAIRDVEEELLTPWRQEVKQSVQDIIVPDEVDWMEDDDMINESYADRALDTIRDRFTR